MKLDDGAFWDELGVAWRATVPDEDLFRSRLERRLRLQAIVSGAALSATAAATLVGLGLGAWTVWIGWSGGTWHFVVRGATLIAAALLTLLATSALRNRSACDVRSLSESLRFSIARTERLARAADLAVAAVAAIGVGGFAGYLVRARHGRPALVSPLEDLLALAVLALALLWFRWGQSRSLEAAKHVSRIFNSKVDHMDDEAAPHQNKR
jgi:MFS family permease